MGAGSMRGPVMWGFLRAKGVSFRTGENSVHPGTAPMLAFPHAAARPPGPPAPAAPDRRVLELDRPQAGDELRVRPDLRLEEAERPRDLGARFRHRLAPPFLPGERAGVRARALHR